MHTSDNNPDGEGLNYFSLQIATIKAEVIADWQTRVRQSILRASVFDETSFIDAMPIIFDGLVEALTPDYPRAIATSGTNLGISHGRERSSRSSYRPQDVAEELILFRDSIFRVAKAEAIFFDAVQVDTILRSVDALVVESLSAFATSQQENTELFIATLAHDMRNPLQFANAAMLLIKIQSKNHAITQLSETAVARLDDVSSMLESLLDAVTSRHRNKLNLRIESCDIAQLASEVIEEMNLGTIVDLNVIEEITGFWCRRSLKRAVQNLLSNSKRHGSKDKIITVTISRFDHRMLLSVHNNGDPIPQSKVDRIFNAYERLDVIDLDGWGFGLPLVRLVAESHGGTVIVDSGDGRGTTFSLNLPIDSRPYSINS
jgi:signal transduction histidine kinase